MYGTKFGITVPMVQNFCWIHLLQRAARQRAAFYLLTGSVEDLPGPITLAVVHILIIISLLVLLLPGVLQELNCAEIALHTLPVTPKLSIAGLLTLLIQDAARFQGVPGIEQGCLTAGWAHLKYASCVRFLRRLSMFVSLAPCQTSRRNKMRCASNIVSVSVSTETSCEAWDG